MDMTKLKFFLVMALAGASVIVMVLANKGFEITTESMIVVGVAIAGISFLVLLFKKRDSISFIRNIKEKPKDVADEATRRLCGFKKFTAYNDLIVFESVNGKLTGHAYIQLDKLPYMIEEMTEDRQLHITASFSRLLGTFNHPFTYMPICKPVPRTRFIKDITHQIQNKKIAQAVAKVPDSRMEIEIKMLEKQLERLSLGESPIQVVYLVQVRESGKTIEEIRKKLEIYTSAMINNLDVIHQVSTRQLKGIEMIDAIHDFFMLEA